jgi:D-glycero-alpha-D-manno-heptose-7-phosphate kinase
LDYLDIDQGIEINHQGDLPARSGLGSSSAFTVGLLNAIYALRGNISSKRELACEAIHIERDILRENVGVQDQIQTAFGGLNKIVINSAGDFDVMPQTLPPKRMHELQDHLLLFFTGVSRTASDIAGDKIKSIPNKQAELHQIQQMVDEAVKILASGQDICEFGKLLHESWMLKRQISSQISPAFVDEIYDRALKSGAVGGKILGAGGGGFMLFFVKPEDKPQLCEALKDLLLVPFAFESQGSQIIFYDNSHYSQMAMNRRDYRHLNDEPVATKPRLAHLLEVKSTETV